MDTDMDMDTGMDIMDVAKKTRKYQ